MQLFRYKYRQHKYMEYLYVSSSSNKMMVIMWSTTSYQKSDNWETLSISFVCKHQASM